MNELSNNLKLRINKYDNGPSSIIVKTSSIFDIDKQVKKKSNCIINLGIVNNIRRVNKFHEKVNGLLADTGIYISCGETLEERRKRVWQKAFFGFKTLVRIIDFIYKRVFPKIPILKKIYFFITKGYNRVMSKAEILGRLISCGFEIVDYFEYESRFYVISKKISKPYYDMSPSYSPIFKMRRIGYKGNIIEVYKLRTMYPYSEYIQDFIIEENKLENSGKIANDYRVTNWGKFCRKFWLDELPMFINFFKGELSLVGVRPLSKGYFKKYPKELQKKRILVKPGLVPPYYVDLPKNFAEILDSEEKYIESKLKSPLYTDIKYFYKAFINIVFKGARSK
tara:strand:+ start:2083 stop:3096 length:1014 start_codon:yes stop_codon:yes gene_type:complete